MNDESAFQTQPAYVQRGSNKKRLVIVFLVVFLLVIAGLGALYLIGSSSSHTTPQPTNPIPTEALATPTPASTSAQLSTTPSASPSGAAESSTALSVTVLNGSGTPGAAGQVASALTAAGFTHVTTGNASAYNYTGITIHVKKSSELPSVEKVVTKASPNAKVTTGVDPTITSDIEVIVGK